MIKVDMHVHSTVSDGSDSIETLIQKAKEKALDGIVITDHDTLSHRKQIPQVEGLRVEAGIEISAYDYINDYRVHILGYQIKDAEAVERFVQSTLEARHQNSLKQIRVLQVNGYNINIDDVKRADGKYIYKQHIMDYLVATGQAHELFGDFYYDTFKNNGMCHFDIRYPDPIQAVRVIREAGGLAVLAHSGQQQNFELIPMLVKNGLNGLEINHHANNERDRMIIKEYAKRYDLFLTGGSDYHGRYEPNSPDVGAYIAEKSGALAVFSEPACLLA